MRFLFLIFAFVFCASQFSLAQKRERFPSYFGFQFKPLIPGDFLAKSTISVQNGNFSGTFKQIYGYSFGAITRIGLTKLISFETGINQIRRNYDVSFSLPDSNLFGRTNLGIISYDIPMNAMVYIQLSEKTFMNASLGASLVNYPTNVGSRIAVDNKIVFSAEGRRTHLFAFEINGNFGFELRTEKSGFFYFGGSVKMPLSAIYKVAAVYEFPSHPSVSATSQVNGAYISLDLRYFFPTVRGKSNQETGPIIQ